MRPAFPDRPALKKFSAHGGFSLIELAVVIVIIGLIMGGVIAGQGLVRNAQLASMGTDIERYRQAVGSFQSQYKELPGDFTRAEAIWGSDSGCPGTSYSATAKEATCNGSGSGIIGDQSGESFRFWQHLANAKMIDGAFSGTADAGSAGVAGVNVPKLAYENGQALLEYYGTLSGDATRFNDQYGHVYLLGKSGNLSLLTTEDAKGMDKKYDDGMGATGIVKSYKYSVAKPCMKSDNSDYNVTNKEVRCHLIFTSGT